MTSGLTGSLIIVLIVSILVSLVIHEFMHAYAGHLLGDSTAQQEGRLSLNPLNHIDPVMTIALPVITILLFGLPILAAKPVPFNPDRVKYDDFGAAIIAVAGPLSNLLLAFAAAFLANSLGLVNFAAEAVRLFIELNVALFVFNLIPIPPLDGSRILYAFAPEILRDVMRQLEPVGLFVIFGLVLMGGFGGFLAHLNQMVLNLLP